MTTFTLSSLLSHRSRVHPDRDAVYYEDVVLSHRDLSALSWRGFEFLQTHGLKKGTRFAVLDFNTTAAIAVFLGGAHIGAVPVFVNWRFIKSEVEAVLEDSGSALLFYGPGFKELAESQSVARPIAFPAFDTAADSAGTMHSESASTADDVLIHLYTSGTTGRPKGVCLTHRNLFDMLERLTMELPGVSPGGVNLVCAPFFHIGGPGYFALGLYLGMTNVLVPRFEPMNVADKMIHHGVTNALLVPAMLHSIMQTAGKRTFPALRHIQYGGSPVAETTLRAAQSYFGCDFSQIYGLTETTGVSTVLRFDDHRRVLNAKEDVWKKRIRSAGKPLLDTSIAVFSPDGRALPPNEPGEVWIQTPHRMKEYHGRPGDLNVIDAQGWFHSGDIGYVDEDGFLFLIDRKNDMIVSGGENIYPGEIERALADFPGLVELCIFGVPDERFGEAVCAAIVQEPNAQISLEKLQTFARDRMASFKIPRHLLLVPELPRNPSGKVLRAKLREMFQ